MIPETDMAKIKRRINNKDVFAEVAFRKLRKLGIVAEKDDNWVYVIPKESEDDNGL